MFIPIQITWIVDCCFYVAYTCDTLSTLVSFVVSVVGTPKHQLFLFHQPSTIARVLFYYFRLNYLGFYFLLIFSQVRTGVLHLLGVENLFYKYGVDLMLWAHEHTYERLWPVFNKQVRVCIGKPLQFSQRTSIFHRTVKNKK